jgi:hypothetical protein
VGGLGFTGGRVFHFRLNIVCRRIIFNTEIAVSGLINFSYPVGTVELRLNSEVEGTELKLALRL